MCVCGWRFEGATKPNHQTSEMCVRVCLHGTWDVVAMVVLLSVCALFAPRNGRTKCALNWLQRWRTRWWCVGVMVEVDVKNNMCENQKCVQYAGGGISEINSMFVSVTRAHTEIIVYHKWHTLLHTHQYMLPRPASIGIVLPVAWWVGLLIATEHQQLCIQVGR